MDNEKKTIPLSTNGQKNLVSLIQAAPKPTEEMKKLQARPILKNRHDDQNLNPILGEVYIEPSL